MYVNSVPRVRIPLSPPVNNPASSDAVQKPLKNQGLFLFLQPNQLSFDSYAEITLAEARQRREDAPAHGFRAMARTILEEVLHVQPEIIEHQLAHVVRDILGRAYNRTTHLAARKKMMQQWADYLDGLKAGAKVISLRRSEKTDT